MELKHDDITGKTFADLVFTGVYSGCKPYYLLPKTMSMLSLLGLHLIPVLSPLNHTSVFSAFLGHSGSSSLKLPCGPVSRKLGSRLNWRLAVSCSAALCLCESLLSIGFHFLMRLFSCPPGFSNFPVTFIDIKLWRLSGKKMWFIICHEFCWDLQNKCVLVNKRKPTLDVVGSSLQYKSTNCSGQYICLMPRELWQAGLALLPADHPVTLWF